MLLAKLIAGTHSSLVNQRLQFDNHLKLEAKKSVECGFNQII